ncbi:MAG: diguanylate cyclase [Noviherbaspirillum sp.]
MEIATSAPPTGFIDLLLDAVCVVDAQGRFVYVSAASERIFGYLPEELIGRNMIELVAPEDRERTLQAAGKIMAGDLQFHFENRYLHKNGQLVHIMWTARWSEKEQLRIAVARDITERKHAESMQAALYEISEAMHGAKGLPDLCAKIHRIIDALLPARNFYVGLHESASGGLDFPYQAEEGEPPAPLTPACATLYAELIRTGQPLLLTPETLSAFPEEVQAIIGCNTQCWLAVPLKSQKGVVGAVFLKSYLAQARYTERHKELLRYVSAQIANAVERMQLHARLQYSSQYDALTDLPNRALFYDRLEIALARVRRSGERMSLLYLDLDKFKQVNDQYGHATGDALLREVGRRLKRCMRDSDTVARIGGDEFAVLLENPRSAETTAAVADKIRDLLSQPMEIEGRTLRILPSIGIALYPDHGQGAQQLLKHADETMYLAKRSGAGAAST